MASKEEAVDRDYLNEDGTIPNDMRSSSIGEKIENWLTGVICLL